MVCVDRCGADDRFLTSNLAFLLIIAKFSDIFGQKYMLLIANGFFFVFSMACGGAKTMTQLYVKSILHVH